MIYLLLWGKMPVWTVGRPVGKIVWKVLVFTLKAKLKLKLNFSKTWQQPQQTVNSLLKPRKIKIEHFTYSRIGDCSFLALHMDANFCRHVSFPYEIKKKTFKRIFALAIIGNFIYRCFHERLNETPSYRYISLPFVKGPHSNSYLDRSHVESRCFLPLGHFIKGMIAKSKLPRCTFYSESF